jgi:3-oxoacyl-[acyl-carrier-protein] synthase-3
MYALITAAAYVKAGQSERALVIGGDTNSRVLNPLDIKTYPLFGDGAGAVFVEPGLSGQGFLAYSMGSEGHGGPLLQREACGSRLPVTPGLIAEGKHYMYMDGHAVFKWAVNILCDTIRDVLDAAKLTVADVNLFVAHQANIRIINAAIDSLHIPRAKVYNNLERYGNTSAGSIPIALDEAAAEGRVKEGDLVVLSGFGAGLTWGTAVMRW